MLGSAALLAATAVKDWLEQNGKKGRVRYYGCPAEEGGAAKAFMVRAGAFDDVDIAISWHPASFTQVDDAQSLANTRMDFEFTGRASHAAAAPHLGRSALDAVELMSVGCNYLREHIPADCRLHYAYLNAGGIAPNVVQAKAKVRYAIRATDLKGNGENGRWFSPLEHHILPKLGKIPVAEIDQNDIRDTLAPIWHAKAATAEKALGRLSICMKHAAALGLDVDLQATEKARALLGKQRHKVTHIPAMPWQEVPAFYASL